MPARHLLFMNLLFIGDIFASPGRKIVADNFEKLCQHEQIDFAIANAENSAGGFGITPSIADDLLALGIDVLTTGNHIWDKREIYEYLNTTERVLRPANYPTDTPGRGLTLLKARNGVAVAVMNLQGRAHMIPVDDPFRKADELIATLPKDVRVRFVDFHAEATSEKVAMGWHLDGRVSAMIGTHTHIPTADERVLPGGMAYLTDSGMTGPYNSIIGVEKEPVLRKFMTSMPVRMEAAKEMVELRGAVVTVDPATGKAKKIKRITLT